MNVHDSMSITFLSLTQTSQFDSLSKASEAQSKVPTAHFFFFLSDGRRLKFGKLWFCFLVLFPATSSSALWIISQSVSPWIFMCTWKEKETHCSVFLMVGAGFALFGFCFFSGDGTVSCSSADEKLVLGFVGT